MAGSFLCFVLPAEHRLEASIMGHLLAALGIRRGIIQTVPLIGSLPVTV